MTHKDIVERGRRVLRMETEALGEAERRIGDEFARAVETIARSKGRVIVSGVGKSGLVGRKIAATLTSTGTPATGSLPASVTASSNAPRPIEAAAAPTRSRRCSRRGMLQPAVAAQPRASVASPSGTLR